MLVVKAHWRRAWGEQIIRFGILIRERKISHRALSKFINSKAVPSVSIKSSCATHSCIGCQSLLAKQVNHYQVFKGNFSRLESETVQKVDKETVSYFLRFEIRDASYGRLCFSSRNIELPSIIVPTATSTPCTFTRRRFKGNVISEQYHSKSQQNEHNLYLNYLNYCILYLFGFKYVVNFYFVTIRSILGELQYNA